MRLGCLFTLAGVALTMSAQAQQAGPVTAGQRLAQSACVQCHTFGKGEPHGAGPNLHGLIGRPAGAVPGYAFSPAYLAAVQGKTWNRALLDRWLRDTQQLAPGSGMVYFQDDPKKRADLVRYLESLH